MRPLEDILGEITRHVQQKTGLEDRFYGLSKLIVRDEQTRPVYIDAYGDTTEISPDDTYDLQVYYRLIDSDTETDTTKGKGSDVQRTLSHTIAMVGIIRQDNTLRQSLIPFAIYNSLPVRSGKGVMLLPAGFSTDTPDILEREFAGAEMDFTQLNISAFSINFHINISAQCAV